MLHKLFRIKFSSYTSQNHSLLPSIYSYTYNDHYLGYLILEHKTRSLISIDPGLFEPAFYNIKLLEQKHGYTLRHVFQTHGDSQHTASTRQLNSKFQNLLIYSGEINQLGTLYQNKVLKEFQPIEIGDLTVCYIQEAGRTAAF